MSPVTSAASRLVVIHDGDEGCGMKERNCTCLLCLKQLPYGLAASHINGTHELKAPDIRALFAQHGARLQPLFDRFLTAIRQRDRGVGEKAWNDLCTNTLVVAHIFPRSKDKVNEAREAKKRLHAILASGFDHKQKALSRRAHFDEDYFGEEQRASSAKRPRISERRREASQDSQDSDVIVIDNADAPGPSSLRGSRRPAARSQHSCSLAPNARQGLTALTQPVSLHVVSHETLFLPGYIPGPFLMISDFCETYHVEKAVCATLEQDGWAHTDTLECLTMANLGALGLKTGEIAQVLGAVKRWAVPKPAGSTTAPSNCKCIRG